MALPKREDYDALRDLFKPHVESFDYFLAKGMETAVHSIRPVTVVDSATRTKLSIFLEKPQLMAPATTTKAGLTKALFPHECRESRVTYRGEFKANLCFQYNDGVVIRETISFGHLPIMLMSKLCHLRGADPKQLISHKEGTEMGGRSFPVEMEEVIQSFLRENEKSY